MANERKRQRRSMLGAFIIASIAYIVLGVFMVMHPQKIADGMNIFLGVIMLVYGIVNIISFFLNKDSEENLFLELAFGVIAAAFGVFSLLAGDVIQLIIFYTIGAILIIDGFVNAKRSFNLKSMGYSRWYIFLIFSALGIIAGILSIVLYYSLGNAVIVMMGIALIYEGIAGLITMLWLSRNKKKIEKELMMVETTADEV